MSLIKLKSIQKTYQTEDLPVAALKDITIEINKQSFVSFIGPSGSGKTTLLNILGCLDKPTAGEIFFNGIRIDQFSPKEAAKFRGDNIGFIFQNFNLLPVLTVYENVEYPLVMIKSLSAQERSERVMRLLTDVGIAAQKDKYPNQISGGQKQRVSIARALVTKPQIVLADEPTANLDHVTAHKIMQVMYEMKKTFQTTFVFSTHDPKIVQEAEIIHTLEDGKIISSQNRTPEALS